MGECQNIACEPLASTRAAARAPDVRWAWVENRLKYCRRVWYKLVVVHAYTNCRATGGSADRATPGRKPAMKYCTATRSCLSQNKNGIYMIDGGAVAQGNKGRRSSSKLKDARL